MAGLVVLGTRWLGWVRDGWSGGGGYNGNGDTSTPVYILSYMITKIFVRNISNCVISSISRSTSTGRKVDLGKALVLCV